jgi:8-oxo-dGTP pyrophosphatase MutT (NUDIX family)
METGKWQLLSSEYLFKHKYIKGRKDRCQLPGGTIVEDYYVMELPVSACAFALTEDNKVLLIKQYRHPLSEVIYEIPGGFIDAGETKETGILRELKEETGYEFSSVKHLGKTAANPGLLNNYTELFLLKGGKKTSSQQLDFDEKIDIVLMDVELVVQLLMKGELKQSMHSLCVFLALQKLGKLTWQL